MFIDEYREYCLSKPETSEGFPFDSDTLVFKVGGKMFALTSVDDFDFVNLKCEPELSTCLPIPFEKALTGPFYVR